jgi:hypothetical protein
MAYLTQSQKDVAGILNFGIKVGPKASTTYAGTTAQTLFTVTGGKCFVTLFMATITTIHESNTNNIKTQTAPTVGTAVALSSDVDTNALEAGGTLYVEGDGSATVKANGGVVLAASAAGRGFIVSEGTITFTPSATTTGAMEWEIWYWPLDDGAAIA